MKRASALALACPFLLLTATTMVAAQDGILAKSWSGTVTGTKKAVNFTIDAVTLKPVRNYFAPAKPSAQWSLGFKADPRKNAKPASGGFFSWLKPKPSRGPDTVEEFLLLERPE